MTGLSSMTGFGAGGEENEHFRVEARLRSVNHRHLDLVVRLPEAQRGLEANVRQLVQSRLTRGHVEVTLEVTPTKEPESRVDIDRQLAERIVEVGRELAEAERALGPVSVSDVLRSPGVLRVSSQPQSWREADTELLLRAVDGALSRLEVARTREGASTEAVLREACRELDGICGRLSEARPDANAALESRLRDRVDRLLGPHELDEQRLAQEVAYLLDKCDVSEETDRLSAHVDHLEEIIVAGGPCGKQLDFLLQEVHRELNTVGSKCRELEMANLVLEGKGVCERLREQVQNVE